MVEEPLYPTSGLAAAPSALALAPDDGALFGLAEEEEPTGRGDEAEDDDAEEPPCGVLVRLSAEGPDFLLRGRPKGFGLGCGAGFVVLVEETDERYVFAASIFDRATGATTPLPLGGDSAGLLPCLSLEDGSVVVAGNGQLFRIEGPRTRPRPLLRGDLATARIDMGADLVAAGGALWWTTVGDTTAPSQLHRAPLAGGEAEIVLRADADEHPRRLAVHGDELLVEWNRQDPRVGRILATELRAVSLRTGAVRTVARLEPMAFASLVVSGGVAWALPLSVGSDASLKGLRAVDLATGAVTTPPFLASERGWTMVADARGLYVSSGAAVRRLGLGGPGSP